MAVTGESYENSPQLGHLELDTAYLSRRCKRVSLAEVGRIHPSLISFLCAHYGPLIQVCGEVPVGKVEIYAYQSKGGEGGAA